MGKKKYTLSDSHSTSDKLYELYLNEINSYKTSLNDLTIIFSLALENKNAFPAIAGFDDSNVSNWDEIYIKKWIKSYYDAHINKPSLRKANPKTSCNDPALRTIVQTVKNQDEQTTISQELDHVLFMSAENVQGNLLEEYIATNIRKYGFIWCEGTILKATDFCNTSGTLQLQIKNKSNTENSSSSAIREGTEIKKWYRLGTASKNRIKTPVFKWDELNEIINDYKTEGLELEPCNLSEIDYRKFLIDICKKNDKIITNESEIKS